jgi:hypothetical protein
MHKALAKLLSLILVVMRSDADTLRKRRSRVRPLLASVVALVLMLAATVGVASASHSALAQQEVVDTYLGAQYALFVPAGWNGRLVVYAHGFFDPQDPLALPDAAPPIVRDWVAALRENLLQANYAVAYSSYSENGWAVRDGAMRTQELPRLFAKHFGEPDKTYLVGRSLGGLIGLMLVERAHHRRSWAEPSGVLALCAPVGGGLLQTDYIANVRVVFDHFFPGLIPGNVLSVEPFDLSTIIPTIVGAITGTPQGVQKALALATVDQIQLPWTGNFADGSLINSLLRALVYNIRGAKDLLERTNGGSPFDNTETIYTHGGTPDSALNNPDTGVGRFEDDKRAVKYLHRFYQPEGEFKVPVLTLHTTLDPEAPFFHEQALAAIGAQEGNSEWLVQQHYNRYGHCNFTPAEAADAFSRLVTWAENGEKPASGALTAP